MPLSSEITATGDGSSFTWAPAHGAPLSRRSADATQTHTYNWGRAFLTHGHDSGIKSREQWVNILEKLERGNTEMNCFTENCFLCANSGGKSRKQETAAQRMAWREKKTCSAPPSRSNAAFYGGSMQESLEDRGWIRHLEQALLTNHTYNGEMEKGWEWFGKRLSS